MALPLVILGVRVGAQVASKLGPRAISALKKMDRGQVTKIVNKVKNAIKSKDTKRLENINNISESNLIWTSGVETWKKIAKKGLWVNGSSDSLGEKENPPIDIFDEIKWYKLSHKDAEEDQLSLISTYELIPKEMPDNIEENSHFYWMSASSFKLVFDKFPSIESANHSCGMGKTFDEINQLIPGKVYPYQNYQDWLEKVKLAK